MTSEPHRTRQLLARRLRRLRATRGWSQEVLAQLSGNCSRPQFQTRLLPSHILVGRLYVATPVWTI